MSQVQPTRLIVVRILHTVSTHSDAVAWPSWPYPYAPARTQHVPPTQHSYVPPGAVLPILAPERWIVFIQQTLWLSLLLECLAGAEMAAIIALSYGHTAESRARHAASIAICDMRTPFVAAITLCFLVHLVSVPFLFVVLPLVSQ